MTGSPCTGVSDAGDRGTDDRGPGPRDLDAVTPGWRRTASWVLCSSALVLGMCATVTRAAGVADAPGGERAVRPAADRTFQLEGRGRGHGRGMSQWGANGAARLGYGYRDILGAYYPGTSPRLGASDTLRVRLTAPGPVLEVVPQEGTDLRVTLAGADQVDGGGLLPETLGVCGVRSWRVRHVSGGLRLEGLACDVWVPQPVRGRLTFRGAMTFGTPRDVVRVLLPGSTPRTRRDYRGTVTATLDPLGTYRIVNTVPLEDYLRSVVPAEMPAGWPLQALKAQAVAARTYALRDALTPGAAWDTCDSTSCQVYPGMADHDESGVRTVRREWTRSDTAVTETAGEILTFGGIPAFTEFGAANGGRTAAGTDPGHHPYQVARDDPWDRVVPNDAHRWEIVLPAASLERAWPGLGRVEAVRVTERDGGGAWGGRVLSVRVDGSAGSVVLPGQAFRSALGLRSTWWRAVPAPVDSPPTVVR